MRSNRFLAVVSSAALILVGFGCGQTKTVAPGVTVKEQGNTATYTDTETGTQVSVGQGATIPDGFPTEIPQYPDGKVTGAVMGGTNQVGAMLNFTASDDAATVSDWYKTTLNGSGWTTGSTFNWEGNYTTTYEKDGNTIAVSITAGSGGSPTTGLVTWSPASN